MAVGQASSGVCTVSSWVVLAFAGPVHLGGAIPQSSLPCPIIQRPSVPQQGEVGLWLLQLQGPREVAASICCSLWEGGLVGVVDTLLQAYQEWSGLLRRQLLHTPATPLIPGSMTEGGLPCKYTGSPSGSRSDNTPTRLPSQASRVGLRPQDSLRCPGWAVAPSVQRRHLGPSQPSLISCSLTGPLGSLQVEAPLLRRRYYQEGTSPQGMDLSWTELLQGSSEGTNVPSGTFHLL